MLKKSSLISMLCIVGATSTAAVFSPSSASAITLDWSFTVGAGSSGDVGGTVKGTISGLVDGSNTSTQTYDITVTSTPDNNASGLEGNYSTFLSAGKPSEDSDIFTVSNGAVTFADVVFKSGAGNILGFVYPGSTPPNAGSPNVFQGPELVSANNAPDWLNHTTGSNFTTFTSTVVPEPINIAGTALALGLGCLMKRKVSLRK